MAKLSIHSKEIKTFFHLLGVKENNITYSIGWALANSESLLKEFIKSTTKWKGRISTDQYIIKLQKYEKLKGFTDIEVECPGQINLIVEAKKGWNYPNCNQLEKYTKRLEESKAQIKKTIVLSECSKEYADAVFKAGKDIFNLSYKEFYKIAKRAYINAKYYEKKFIKELNTYLTSIMKIQKLDSNLVYVVSLDNKKPKGWTISNRNIVNKKRFYEYPIGKNWPDPPNYIAFRYDGELQTIHHVESYDVFTNPRQFFKEAPSERQEPHYILKLGKPFKPEKVVKNGKIYPSGRYWCMLDTLFTCKTIKEARDVTKKRREQMNNI